MQYQFYLDGNLLVENPTGWDQMAVNVKRDNDLKGVLVNLDASLTFTSDGYDYLKNIFDTAGYCAEVRFSAYRSTDDGQNFIEKYKGLLKLPTMSFDDFNCSVTVQVTDDSFYGRVDKRRNTEAYLTGVSTINEEIITPPTIRAMDLFDPATGNYVPLTQNYGCYRVYDVLEYLVGFMTDNEVEFDSPFFGSGGDFYNLMLTYGYSIRQTGNGVGLTSSEFIEHLPAITFQKLFTELNKRFNLGFYVDLSGAKPKIIIDAWQELFRANTVATFPDLPNLKTEIAKELIYSSVKFGGSKTLDMIAASFPETIRFVGFNSEQFLITGKCNVDNVLDLSYDYVSSSNVIEEILILSGTDDSYDKDWFLIDSDLGSGGRLVARQSNWLTPGVTPPLYYNERLTNYETAKRYIGFVPNAIAAYLGTGNDGFQASSPATSFAVTPFSTYVTVPFPDDSTSPNFDAGGNYSTVTNEFTVPTSGVYTFETSGTLRLFAAISNQHQFSLWLSRYDFGGTLIGRTRLTYISRAQSGTTDFPYQYSQTLVVSATDRLRIEAFFQPADTAHFNSANIFAGRIFACTNTANGGGVYQTYDPADYPIIKNIFTTEIFETQTDAITTNPLSQIGFYIEAANSKLAWVDEIVIDEFKGTISAKLLTSRNGLGVTYPPELRVVQITSTIPDAEFAFSIADYYGDPEPGQESTTKTFFYAVGKILRITIPATFAGRDAGDSIGQTIVIHRTGPGVDTYQSVYTPDLSVEIEIESQINYTIFLGFNAAQPGITMPEITPSVIPPFTAGGMGSASFTPYTGTLADYIFLWSTGATTSGISAPAGDYTCQVTYLPGTFNINVLTFNLQIAISFTGA